MSIIPYPSNVFVPSFVSVKLSGRDNYSVWKAQMLCLLESHDMLLFINGIPVGSIHNHELWKRSDALVRGWILGSLSEQAAMYVTSKLQQQKADFTAKNVWSQVERMYATQPAVSDKREVSIGGTSFHDPKQQEGRPIELKNDKNSAIARANMNKRLYVAVERGSWKQFDNIVKKSSVKVTDIIGVNGNTALHLAVARTTDEDDQFVKDDFLEKILNMKPPDISLLDVRNSDGSTLLHIAASLGNTHAAKILVDKSRDLLCSKDNEGCTPLDIVLSNPKHKEMCMYLLSVLTPDIEESDTTTTLFAEARGEEPLVNAISNKDFDLANTLIKRYNTLKSDVLMAIAQHCPSDFSLPESILYELLNKTVWDLVTRASVDIESSEGIGNKGCILLTDFGLRVALVWTFQMLVKIFSNLKVFRNFYKKANMRMDAIELLDTACGTKFRNVDAGSQYRDIYSKPVLECIRLDASYVLERIVFWFPDAIKIMDEDGNNILQTAWRNRAWKVYSLLIDGKMAKNTSMTQKIKDDPCGNNFLHFAARLGPTQKLDLISGPPFQLQRELRWFKVAKDMVPQGIMEKNACGETPDMVFTREHKELVIQSENWMKNTANAYIITAILIITVVFAASIQIPGGTKDNGIPRFKHNLRFIVFVSSIAISMVSSTLSLLLFLSITISRFSEQDFVRDLPLALVTSLLSLFVSATFTVLAFGTALFLMCDKDDTWVIGLVIPLVGLPVGAFTIYQTRLVFDLLISTKQFETISLFRGLKLLDRIYI